MEGEMITFKVPKETLEKVFLGKPGENYEMPMTPDFQELMREKLGTGEIPPLTVTFEEHKGVHTYGDTILATFETKQA